MSTSPPPTHGLRFEGTGFYVIHRRREYGPFDYQWSDDLRAVDLTYRGTKYGEVWSPAQLYVDLREFRLPQRVVQVAVIVVGGVLQSLRIGDTTERRQLRIAYLLRSAGCGRFAVRLELDAG